MAVATKKRRLAKRVTTLDILNLGLKKLQRGWCQNDLGITKQGESVGATEMLSAQKVCAIGSLYYAEQRLLKAGLGNGHSAIWRASDLLDRVAQRESGRFSAVSFNDAFGRQKREVVALMKKAIKLARKRSRSAK